VIHNENNLNNTDPAKEKLLDHEKGKLEFVKVDVELVEEIGVSVENQRPVASH
jgi:hypothetical protein